MGHRDSPTQFGRHGEVFGPRRGTAAADSPKPSFGGSTREKLSATSPAGRVFLAVLRVYKVFLSPFFGGACKYHPSCSNYAYEAVERHGARRGVLLSLKRLGRCRPFTQGGYDPVPETLETRAERARIANQEPVR